MVVRQQKLARVKLALLGFCRFLQSGTRSHFLLNHAKQVEISGLKTHGSNIEPLGFEYHVTDHTNPNSSLSHLYSTPFPQSNRDGRLRRHAHLLACSVVWDTHWHPCNDSLELGHAKPSSMARTARCLLTMVINQSRKRRHPSPP